MISPHDCMTERPLDILRHAHKITDKRFIEYKAKDKIEANH